MLTKILTCTVVFSFLLLVPACEDGGTSVDGTAFVAYKYAAFDTLGNTVVRGALWLQFDSTKVTGIWKFDDKRSGELEGFLDKDTLTLNLNPGFVDNNLFLLGVFTVNTYTGRWEQVGFPGVIREGAFSAARM